MVGVPHRPLLVALLTQSVMHWLMAILECESDLPLSSEYGTCKTVRARFWPCSLDSGIIS